MSTVQIMILQSIFLTSRFMVDVYVSEAETTDKDRVPAHNFLSPRPASGRVEPMSILIGRGWAIQLECRWVVEDRWLSRRRVQHPLLPPP